MPKHVPKFVWAVYTLCVASSVVVQGVKHDSHVTFPMCTRDAMQLHATALSQDTLYNTAMAMCRHGSLSNWRYRNTFASPPPAMAEAYEFPDNSRLECAHVKLECLVPLPAPLSSIWSSVDSAVNTVSCLRGAHVYSLWTIPHTVMGSNTTVLQDLHLHSDLGQADVYSNISTSVSWPWSVFSQQIRSVIENVCHDAAKSHVRIMCK